MNKRDYYEILGVPRNVSEANLKKAYRQLARKHHPDVNPGEKAAEERFKEISEAYAVLSDAEQRKKYDRMGHDAFGPGFDPFAGFRSGARGGAGGGGGGDSGTWTTSWAASSAAAAEAPAGEEEGGGASATSSATSSAPPGSKPLPGRRTCAATTSTTPWRSAWTTPSKDDWSASP